MVRRTVVKAATLLTLLGVGCLCTVPAQAVLIVSADEWPTSSTGFGSNYDAGTLVANVARSFASGSAAAQKFLIYSYNFGYDGYFQNALKAAGSDYSFDQTLTPGDLSAYAGIFVGGYDVDQQKLTTYLKNGGNVYLVGGTGAFSYYDGHEEGYWNHFLNQFGLEFSPYPECGIKNIDSFNNDPIFNGVNKLYTDNPNVMNLTGNAVDGWKTTILSSQYGYNWWAKAEMANVNPVPEPSSMLLMSIGLAGFAGFMKLKMKK